MKLVCRTALCAAVIPSIVNAQGDLTAKPAIAAGSLAQADVKCFSKTFPRPGQADGEILLVRLQTDGKIPRMVSSSPLKERVCAYNATGLREYAEEICGLALIGNDAAQLRLTFLFGEEPRRLCEVAAGLVRGGPIKARRINSIPADTSKREDN